jgi:hypothetical protein
VDFMIQVMAVQSFSPIGADFSGVKLVVCCMTASRRSYLSHSLLMDHRAALLLRYTPCLCWEMLLSRTQTQTQAGHEWTLLSGYRYMRFIIPRGGGGSLRAVRHRYQEFSR